MISAIVALFLGIFFDGSGGVTVVSSKPPPKPRNVNWGNKKLEIK